MANQIRRKLGEFIYSRTLFLRVIGRNIDYDLEHRPVVLGLKLVIGLKLMREGFRRFGYNDWLHANIEKEDSEEAIERRFESSTTRLEMLERLDEENKAVPVCNATT